MATLSRCVLPMVLTPRLLECVLTLTFRILHYQQCHSSTNCNLAVTHRSHLVSLTTTVIIATKATPRCSPRAPNCMLFVLKQALPLRNQTRPLRHPHRAPHRSPSRAPFCRTPSSLVNSILINSDPSSNCKAVNSPCSVRRRRLVRAPTTTDKCNLSNLTICTTGVCSTTSTALSTRRATHPHHPYQVGKLVFFCFNQCTGTNTSTMRQRDWQTLSLVVLLASGNGRSAALFSRL